MHSNPPDFPGTMRSPHSTKVDGPPVSIDIVPYLFRPGYERDAEAVYINSTRYETSKETIVSLKVSNTSDRYFRHSWYWLKLTKHSGQASFSRDASFYMTKTPQPLAERRRGELPTHSVRLILIYLISIEANQLNAVVSRTQIHWMVHHFS